jgi:hypothetical protein
MNCQPMKRSKYLPVIRRFTNPEIFRKRISAIYFLLDDDKIIYIGKTTDLDARICYHKCTIKKFNRFRFIECSEEKLSYYEKRLIALFQPLENTYNKNHPEKLRVVSVGRNYFAERIV